MTHDRQCKPGLGLLYRDARHAAAERISRSTTYSFQDVDAVLEEADKMKLSLAAAVLMIWHASERNVHPSQVVQEMRRG